MGDEPSIDTLIVDAIKAIDLLEDPASEEYTTAVRNLEALVRVRDANKPAPRPKLDPNVVASGGFSALSLMSIVNAERVGIVATKALAFIPKIRLI